MRMIIFYFILSMLDVWNADADENMICKNVSMKGKEVNYALRNSNFP